MKAILEGEVIVNLENGDNLSWIVKHPKLENIFYATHEVEVGAVSRWKIDEEGQLKMLEKISSGGTHPTHLAINDRGTELYVANYGIPYGTFSVFKLDKVSGKMGILGPSYTNTYGAGSNAVPNRQEYSHPHAVIAWRHKKKSGILGIFLPFCQIFEDLWPFSMIFGNYPVSPLYLYVVDLGADKIYHYTDDLRYGFCKKSLRKDEPLTS